MSQRIETVTCPHPEDESDAYLLNGIWYQDIEPEFYECTHPSCHAECVSREDYCAFHLAEVEADEIEYEKDVETRGPLFALCHFLDRAFRS